MGVEPERLPGDLSEARNVSSQKRALSPFVYRLSRVAKFMGLGWSSMPQQTKLWLNKIPGLSRAYPSAEVWDSPALPGLITEMRPEAERLLKFAGKPIDYWSWEKPREGG